MSIRAYRLLRNNKEEGPFTAEEIVQKNLKPYDLIWIDGRSAAWSYPGELAEFKKYVPSAEEEVNGLFATNRNSNAISSSVQAAVAMNNNIIQPTSTSQKPRYKVSAAWSRIQTITAPVYAEAVTAEAKKIAPKKLVETNHAGHVDSKSLSWEEAWMDWEKEKTVTPVANVVKQKGIKTSPSKTINEDYVAPALETKYEESLDSIKDRYIENVLQQKQKSKKGFAFGKASSEFVIPSLALIIIFSVGYWLLHNNTNETAAAVNSSAPVKTTQPVQQVNQQPDNANTITATQNQNQVADQQNIASTNNSVLTDQAEERKPVITHAAKFTPVKDENTASQNNQIAASQLAGTNTKSTNQTASNNPSKQFDPSVINNVPSNDGGYNNASNVNAGDLNALDTRPVKRRTNAGDNTDNTSSQNSAVTSYKAVNSKSTGSYIAVPEYVDLNNGSADLKIQNISDLNLDLVVVDVQYYDASNGFRKGETLYLHNLRAGKTVVVKTPKDINSQYATAKVSLVSSDANNVYVIGDN